MTDDGLSDEEKAQIRALDIAEAKRLNALDDALRASALAYGCPAEAMGLSALDDREGILEDPPELADPRLAHLPEGARWLAWAHFRIGGDGAHVMALETDLGVWSEAELDKVVNAYLRVGLDS